MLQYDGYLGDLQLLIEESTLFTRECLVDDAVGFLADFYGEVVFAVGGAELQGVGFAKQFVNFACLGDGFFHAAHVEVAVV